MSVPRTTPRTLVRLCSWTLLSLGALLLTLATAAAEQDRADPKPGDVEKRLDRLLKEIEDLRRGLAKDKDKDKADPKNAEQADKARTEVKKQTAEVEKLQEQLREARGRLEKAQNQ